MAKLNEITPDVQEMVQRAYGSIGNPSLGSGKYIEYLKNAKKMEEKYTNIENKLANKQKGRKRKKPVELSEAELQDVIAEMNDLQERFKDQMTERLEGISYDRPRSDSEEMYQAALRMYNPDNLLLGIKGMASRINSELANFLEQQESDDLSQIDMDKLRPVILDQELITQVNARVRKDMHGAVASTDGYGLNRFLAMKDMTKYMTVEETLAFFNMCQEYIYKKSARIKGTDPYKSINVLFAKIISDKMRDNFGGKVKTYEMILSDDMKACEPNSGMMNVLLSEINTLDENYKARVPASQENEKPTEEKQGEEKKDSTPDKAEGHRLSYLAKLLGRGKDR